MKLLNELIFIIIDITVLSNLFYLIIVQKEKNEFTEWIDDAISKKHLKYYKYELFIDRKEIGSGSFGTVYKTYNNHYRKDMVLKALKINNLPSEKIVEEIVNEVN